MVRRVLRKENAKEVRRTALVVLKRRFQFYDESVVLPKGGKVYFDDTNFEIVPKSQVKTATFLKNGHSRHTGPDFQANPR